MEVVPSAGANVYDILRRDALVVARESLDQLRERLA
jgi:ribosomal protein L4